MAIRTAFPCLRVVAAALAGALLLAALPAGARADEWTEPSESGPDVDDEPADTTASDTSSKGLILKTPFAGDRKSYFDVHAGFSFSGFGFGVGGRFTLNLIDNGFIPSLNNSFGIGFGVIVMTHFIRYGFYDGFGLSFVVPVVAQWVFYLTNQWTVFAEAGLGLWIRPIGRNSTFCDSTLSSAILCSPVWLWYIAGVGAMYNFSTKMSLILRVQYPMVSAGVTF